MDLEGYPACDGEDSGKWGKKKISEIPGK